MSPLQLGHICGTLAALCLALALVLPGVTVAWTFPGRFRPALAGLCVTLLITTVGTLLMVISTYGYHWHQHDAQIGRLPDHSTAEVQAIRGNDGRALALKITTRKHAAAHFILTRHHGPGSGREFLGLILLLAGLFSMYLGKKTCDIRRRSYRDPLDPIRSISPASPLPPLARPSLDLRDNASHL